MVAEGMEMLIRRRGRWSMVDVEGGREPRLDQGSRVIRTMETWLL